MSEGATETVAVTLDEDDLFAAYRLLGRRNQRQARLITLLVVFLIMLIVMLIAAFPEARYSFFDDPLTAALSGVVIFLMLVIAAILVALRPLQRRAARITLAEHPGLGDPVVHTIAPEAFGTRTVFSDALFPWSRLQGWREDERIVLVLLTRRLFYAVPKRFLSPDQLELLRGRLQGRAP